MRKITLLLATFIFCFLYTGHVNAASKTSIPNYFVEQYFTGSVAYPSGWADATSLVGSNNATVSWTSPASNQLSMAGSGSGTRGRSISFPTSGTETTVYVDFDMFITSSFVAHKNAFAMLLHDNAGNNILSLYACGNDGKFHYWNTQKDSIAFIGGSFNRAGNDVTICNNRNAGSQIDIPYATGVWFNIRATLDFTNKIVSSLTVTNKTTNATVTSLNQPFISSSASDISKISIMNTRSSVAGNGSNANLNASIDNFKTYKLVEVATDQVTINYKDINGNELKTARIQQNVEVGTTYTALSTDKATFSDASFYYSYDAANTSSDNVVVASGGASAITLIFKKTPITAGTYTWTGLVNSTWDNGTENFTTDNLNSLGYQDNNPVIFPSTATNKTVNLDTDLNLGTNNITISGTGYSLNGIGSISGTGSINVNLTSEESATIGLKNNMTGGLNINGGTVTVTNDLGSGNYTMADGSKIVLQTGSNVSKSISGSGTITIEAKSNNYYLMPVSGASTVNIILDNAGSGTSATWTDYFGGSFPSGAQINVSSTVGSAGFGVGDALLSNCNVNLGDDIRLLRWYNQSTSGGGTSTILVGSLSGNASSTIEGGMVDASNRILAYEIGSSNANATFNGVIKNFGTVTAAPLNIYKKGTGIWTLTGAITYSPGLFNVDAGTVIMNGSLSGTAVPVTVASGATLSGNGNIAGVTTINGTLEGKLNFGNNLTLAGTTNIVVNGFNNGEYDVINVVGAVTNGGTLNITVNGANPSVGSFVKVVNAGSYSGTFATINLPANYHYDSSNGTLYYSTFTDLSNSGSHALRIYPTLTHNSIIVDGNAISTEVITLAGQVVKQIKNLHSKTSINLSDLSNGSYIVKVKLADGSVKVQNILFQK